MQEICETCNYKPRCSLIPLGTMCTVARECFNNPKKERPKLVIYHSDFMTDNGLFEALCDCMAYVYATEVGKAISVICDM